MLVQSNFTLIGALEGRSITVAERVKFVDGVFQFVGTADETENLSRYLAMYSAYPEGSVLDAARDALAASGAAGEVPTPVEVHTKTVDQGPQPDPLEIRQAGKDAADKEQQDAKGPAAETLAEALSLLKKDLNAHWTGQGLPSVDAVAALLGRAVTRKEIEEAAPGFKRPA